MASYGQHVQEVEHASFTPIVLAVTGGLAHETMSLISDWLSLLSVKWGGGSW